MRKWRGVACLLFVLTASGTASAQDHGPVTDGFQCFGCFASLINREQESVCIFILVDSFLY